MEMFTPALNGIFDARAHSGFVKAVELYPFAHHLPRHDFSSASPKAGSHIVGVENPMHHNEHDSDLRLQNRKQEHFGLESTLMKIYVEDDIEDPDDSEADVS